MPNPLITCIYFLEYQVMGLGICFTPITLINLKIPSVGS
jgi:hypothetical protein